MAADLPRPGATLITSPGAASITVMNPGGWPSVTAVTAATAVEPDPAARETGALPSVQGAQGRYGWSGQAAGALLGAQV